MFTGRSALVLDAKGRMSIPARYRASLVDPESGQSLVTITTHYDDYLLIYAMPAWREKCAQLAALDDDDAEMQVRKVLGNAEEVEIDGSGRILIPPQLRALGRLESDGTRALTMLGVGNKFELWPAAEFAEKEKKDNAALAAPGVKRIRL